MLATATACNCCILQALQTSGERSPFCAQTPARSHNLSCEKLLKLQDLHFYFHVCGDSSWRLHVRVQPVERGGGGGCCFAIFLPLVYVYYLYFFLHFFYIFSIFFFVTILHIFLFNNEATIEKRQLVQGTQREWRGEREGG